MKRSFEAYFTLRVWRCVRLECAVLRFLHGFAEAKFLLNFRIRIARLPPVEISRGVFFSDELAYVSYSAARDSAARVSARQSGAGGA